MNSPFPDDQINAPNEDIPEAISGPIDAARGALRRGLGYLAALSLARLRRPGVQGEGPQCRGRRAMRRIVVMGAEPHGRLH
jgi:hypothetical protein